MLPNKTLFGKFPQIYSATILKEKLTCITSIKNGYVKRKKKNQIDFIDFKVVITADGKTTKVVCGMFQFKAYNFGL